MATSVSSGVVPLLRDTAKNIAYLFLSKETIAEIKSRFLPRDFVYDTAYFQNDVDAPALKSAGTIVSTVVEELAPRSVIDVGCGTGALLATFRDAGCDVKGLEFARAAIAICQKRGLDVQQFDIVTGRYVLDRKYDVATSLEVAEHLPEHAADRYVHLLTRLSWTVVFTAATPGQGGTDHRNEQPVEYWVERFARYGHELDEALTRRWRANWEASGQVQSWYYNNLMVFQAKPSA
jgi:SAM-dependent methyltransferase